MSCSNTRMGSLKLTTRTGGVQTTSLAHTEKIMYTQCDVWKDAWQYGNIELNGYDVGCERWRIVMHIGRKLNVIVVLFN